MSHELAHLWFYDGEKHIANRDSAYIPRIGETVGLERKWWNVVGIEWTFVSPDSMNFKDGLFAPIVSVRLEKIDL